MFYVHFLLYLDIGSGTDTIWSDVSRGNGNCLWKYHVANRNLQTCASGKDYEMATISPRLDSLHMCHLYGLKDHFHLFSSKH